MQIPCRYWGVVIVLLLIGLLIPFAAEWGFLRSGMSLLKAAPQQNLLKTTTSTTCTVAEPTANYTLEVDSFQPSTFTDFLSGPGLTVASNGGGRNDSKQVAVCQWLLGTGTNHFAHELEQLLGCWSWWNSHRRHDNTTALVLYREKVPFRPKEMLKWRRVRQSKRYIQSFVSALQQAFGLKVVTSDEQAKELLEDGTASLLQNSVRNQVHRRGYHMASQFDAPDLRDGVRRVLRILPERSICGRNYSDTTNHTRLLVPRVAILNRQPTNTRSLLQANRIAHEIQQAFKGKIYPTVPVEYFEGTSFAHQVAFFSATDIVISPHGAQLASVPFLPTCGAFLEIFPKNYYDQQFYGSLAESAGIKQYTLYLAPSMKSAKEDFEKVFREKKDRGRFRNVNLCPSSAKIIDAVAAMVSAWNECCQNLG